MRYSTIPSKLFADRRKEFAKKMEPGSIAIFYSNDQVPRSGDQFYPYRQNSALFSLSGIDQEGTILVIYPKSKKKAFKEILFVLAHDPKHSIWNGDRLSQKQVSKISGIDTIIPIDKSESLIQDLIKRANSVYINSNEEGNSGIGHSSLAERKSSELKKLSPSHNILSSQSILRQTAMVKHPVEIELLKKAIQVTGLAFDRVLRNVHPGMREFEVEAELSYVLGQNGCRHAFEPIVASGKSACTLHYISNDKKIQPGTLILIDFGAEYANMASDMTRTIPVSGRFTKEQKKIYNAVLFVLQEVTQMMQPGMSVKELNAEAGKLIESELIKLKVLSKGAVKKQDIKSPLWQKYFMHGVSHHLGYDVHDLADRDVNFREGMVLTCEPGIYLPDLKTGIRLENDILITGKGPQNLMASIPIEPDEIESIMQSKTY